jgi:Arc/MetJ family transcription regulator
MARTNSELDERLVSQGMRIFTCKSRRELVHLALAELLRGAKRREILTLRGLVNLRSPGDSPLS